MFSRRIAMATMTALLLSTAAVGPVAAKKPAPVPAEITELPLTADEVRQSNEKVAAARAYLAEAGAVGLGAVIDGCPTPTGGGGDVTTGTTQVGGGGGTPDACWVPQGFIGLQARDQTRGHYCGPAVGQVISNWSWAMGWGRNKYSQRTIARWMQTDRYGGTNAHRLEDGLEAATVHSPRRPWNWNWVVTYLRDYDGTGTVSDDMQRFVRTNISGSRMPLAIAVKPYDHNSGYHLVSWSRPVKSVGHWIAAYGWWSYYTGSDFARIYYTDSSEDEGGSTGKYWDPTRHIARMIMEHTQRFVW